MFKLFKKKEKLTALPCDEGLQLSEELIKAINFEHRRTIGRKYRIFIGGHFIKVRWNEKVAVDGHLYKPKQLIWKNKRF